MSRKPPVESAPPSEAEVDETDVGFLADVGADLKQLVGAAPSGAVVFMAGLIFAFWSNFRIADFAGAASTRDAELILEALRIVSVVLWICVALWGRQIMVVARNREETQRRLEYQGTIMETIEESLRSRLVIKDEEVVKARNFWDRLRNDPKL